nr:uncharacterized protein LOC128689021 [Cherax quadricarinatus]
MKVKRKSPLTSVNLRPLRPVRIWKFCSRLEEKNRPSSCSYLEKLAHGCTRAALNKGCYSAMIYILLEVTYKNEKQVGGAQIQQFRSIYTYHPTTRLTTVFYMPNF